MTAEVNNLNLEFSIKMGQLYSLCATDIELYKDFFVLYNEKDKSITDKAQMLYIAYLCANLDNKCRLSENQFYDLLEDNMQAVITIYNRLFHKKSDWTFAEVFERHSKSAIRFPKSYHLADVDDYYTFFVLNLGVGDETFWNVDIEFLNNVAINKNAFDSYINYEIEKKR